MGAKSGVVSATSSVCSAVRANSGRGKHDKRILEKAKIAANRKKALIRMKAVLAHRRYELFLEERNMKLEEEEMDLQAGIKPWSLGRERKKSWRPKENRMRSSNYWKTNLPWWGMLKTCLVHV